MLRLCLRHSCPFQNAQPIVVFEWLHKMTLLVGMEVVLGLISSQGLWLSAICCFYEAVTHHCVAVCGLDSGRLGVQPSFCTALLLGPGVLCSA